MKTLIAELLFPDNCKCWICDEEAILDELGMCGSCAAKFISGSSAVGPAELDGFTSGAIYTDDMSKAMQGFKYNNHRWKAAYFAKLISIPESWEIDCIVPVPMHENKRKKRGYNQTELLAECMSERLGVPVESGFLRRKKESVSQTKLTAAQRAENVKGAFERLKRADGLKILLVDDVRTTGSTMRECAKQLRKAGAAKIYGASACARDR